MSFMYPLLFPPKIKIFASERLCGGGEGLGEDGIVEEDGISEEEEEEGRGGDREVVEEEGRGVEEIGGLWIRVAHAYARGANFSVRAFNCTQ